MNFCPGSKNSIIGKAARYDRIINELCHFYKVFMIQKITKMSFNIPLRFRISKINHLLLINDEVQCCSVTCGFN